MFEPIKEGLFSLKYSESFCNLPFTKRKVLILHLYSIIQLKEKESYNTVNLGLIYVAECKARSLNQTDTC